MGYYGKLRLQITIKNTNKNHVLYRLNQYFQEQYEFISDVLYYSLFMSAVNIDIEEDENQVIYTASGEFKFFDHRRLFLMVNHIANYLQDSELYVTDEDNDRYRILVQNHQVVKIEFGPLDAEDDYPSLFEKDLDENDPDQNIY